MSETNEPEAALDPKEQMRRALEAKKAGHHRTAEAGKADGGKSVGGSHGPAGAKKQFTRRKAGG